MGGNIFKNKVNIGRISTKDLEENYKPKLKSLLDKLFSKYSFLPYIKEKKDHGDIDVLVDVCSFLKPASNSELTVKECIVQQLSKEGISDFNLNGNTLSFLFNDQQVDLMLSSEHSFNWELTYYSYNDLGGLIGTLLHNVGLSYGYLGLYYKQYNENKSDLLKTHYLSLCVEDVFKILQLDINVVKNGFETYKEMFDYLYSSPLFDSSLFCFENMTNKKRSRPLKRNTYQLASQYYKTLPLKVSFGFNVFSFFDKLEKDCEKIVKEVLVKKDYDSIINGFILMSLSDKFKENFNLIKDFKQKMSNKHFHLTSHTLTHEVLLKEVSEYLSTL